MVTSLDASYVTVTKWNYFIGCIYCENLVTESNEPGAKRNSLLEQAIQTVISSTM